MQKQTFWSNQKNRISSRFVNQQFLQKIVAMNHFLNRQRSSADTVKKIIEIWIVRKKKRIHQKKFEKVLFNIAESDDDSTVFDDKDIRIYRIFERTAAFDFDSKKKTVESLKFDNDFMMCFDNFENDILQHTSVKSISSNIASNTSFIKNTFLNSISMMKHFLKSKNFYQSKNLKYKIYTSILTKIHLNNETELDFCYDTESKFFLIRADIVRDHYAEAKVFQINNEQKIRC